MKNSIRSTKNRLIAKIESKIEHYDGMSDELNRPNLPTVGRKYLCTGLEYVGPGTSNGERLSCWSDESAISDGCAGNMDSSIRRFHGWRGTTNDVAVYAYGVRVCERIIRREYRNTVRYTIIMGADEAHGRY